MSNNTYKFIDFFFWSTTNSQLETLQVAPLQNIAFFLLVNVTKQR